MRIRTAARVALVGALAFTTVATGRGVPTAAADSSPVAESFMQIVAHQDDDILFMNPDISREYSDPSVTVYLTAGEATDDTWITPYYPSSCAYAESRAAGARAAHAKIAGVSDPHWTATPLKLSSTGKTVEVDTLNEAPQVKLVFFRLHASGDSNFIPPNSQLAANGPATLDDLFTSGPSMNLFDSTMGSIGTDGDCAAATNNQNYGTTYGNQSFSHADLTASLTELMQHFSPTVVLAQDPKVGF
ncbi:PIG-L family deacetylase [Kitasatospora sp. NPDC048296]|uniref:PIG-L family deacetylase n=1 Tax=Kitasatospora sp. NPDC048296 TaxID=3364048 RepID=UPI003711792C